MVPFWIATTSVYFAVAAACTQITTTPTFPSTTTSATPSCTASSIATLCGYSGPGLVTASSADSGAFCLSYCNTHQPCDFAILVPANRTCLLYAGNAFDAKAGSPDCGDPGRQMLAYGKPQCASGTPTSSNCVATAPPSALAEVCGYPPPGDCLNGCYGSEGALNCLGLCAQADACNYAVFNPESNMSPQASGTCWIYPNGTYKAQSTIPCKGKPEQYVYNNLCPKPSSSSASSSLSSSSLSSSATSPTGTGVTGTTEGQKTSGQQNNTQNSAQSGLLPYSPFFTGMVVLMSHALR